MNKEFHKFINKLAALTVSIIAVFMIMLLSGIFIIGCTHEDNYDASILDKVARLKSIDKPKIILVGNSNLAFGIDSQMIEKTLRMPVVNLGLHGGLGNVFHENIAKLAINSGDIVIICHSTFSDEDKIIDTDLAWITIEYHKALWEIIRPKDYLSMIWAFPVYWYESLTKRLANEKNISEVYSRHNFNKYGDIMSKPESKRLGTDNIFERGKVNVPGINDICIDRLNEFNMFIKHSGAIMLVAGYPIANGKYTPPIEEYDAFQKKLREKLDCEVISDYKDYFIPYEYFYDTVLHLDDNGTKIRTQQLISDLMNWQQRRLLR